MVVLEQERAGNFSESHVGLEYTINDFLQFQGGLKGHDFIAGVSIEKDTYQFDYAYCAGNLGNTYRLSFAIKI